MSAIKEFLFEIDEFCKTMGLSFNIEFYFALNDADIFEQFILGMDSTFSLTLCSLSNKDYRIDLCSNGNCLVSATHGLKLLCYFSIIKQMQDLFDRGNTEWDFKAALHDFVKNF